MITAEITIAVTVVSEYILAALQPLTAVMYIITYRVITINKITKHMGLYMAETLRQDFN